MTYKNKGVIANAYEIDAGRVDIGLVDGGCRAAVSRRDDDGRLCGERDTRELPRAREIRRGTARTANVADGAWHHVAVSYAKATDAYTLIYDYDASASVQVVAGGKRAYTAAGLLLGTMLNNLAGERFVGKISCLRVTKRVLTPGEFLVAGDKPKSGLTILVK